MSYQLKATGIAANCTMLIAVDPDDSTVKDFASSSVTSTLTFNSSTTSSIGTAAWNGLTRSYVSLVDPSDIAFGANKPQLVHDSTTATQLTVAAGVEVGSTLNGVIFGTSVSAHFATRNISGGGSTHPSMAMVNTRNGTLAVTAGEKRVFGWSSVYSGSYTSSWWSALHDDAAMTTGVPSPSNLGGATWNLDYIGRRNDSTSSAFNGKVFFVAIFDTELTEAQWDSLRDDWFGTLLEAVASGPVLSSPTGTATGTTTATIGATTDTATGTLYGFVSASATPPSATNLKAGTGATWSGSVAVSSTGAKTLSATGLSAGTGYYAHLLHNDGANDSNIVTSAQFTTTSLTKKLKLLVHPDAQSDSGVAGVVFQAPAGADITGAKIGEFTGKAFEATLESGKAVLKVPVADFGGSALTTSDTPVALVRNSTDTTGIISGTVIEE